MKETHGRLGHVFQLEELLCGVKFVEVFHVEQSLCSSEAEPECSTWNVREELLCGMKFVEVFHVEQFLCSFGA